MNTEEKLKEYKLVTEEIIFKISGDEDIQPLMKKREIILKSIFESGYIDKILVKKIYEDLDLEELDKKLKNCILNEQLKVKEELKEIHARKQANNIYNNQLSKINFLNKTI